MIVHWPLHWFLMRSSGLGSVPVFLSTTYKFKFLPLENSTYTDILRERQILQVTIDTSPVAGAFLCTTQPPSDRIEIKVSSERCQKLVIAREIVYTKRLFGSIYKGPRSNNLLLIETRAKNLYRTLWFWLALLSALVNWVSDSITMYVL